MNRSLAVVVISTGILGACAQQPPKYFMSNIMQQCDSVTVFSGYVKCIKDNYNVSGIDPASQDVRSFYAQLDAINERPLSYVEAKAAAYRAYDATVGAGNRANRGVLCLPIAGTIICR